MSDDEWPALADQFFNFMHGPLLDELGYPRTPAAQPEAPTAELFAWARGLAERNRVLAAECDARLTLINRLSDEAQKRLEIINRFAGAPR